jgi:hypothetical protein
LLGVSLVFISIPVNFTLALFERTGQALFLSPHFIGGFLLYVFLIMVWVQAHRTARSQAI